MKVDAPSTIALMACSSRASAVSPVIDVTRSIVLSPYSVPAVAAPAIAAPVQKPAPVPAVATVVTRITGAKIIPIFAVWIVVV